MTSELPRILARGPSVVDYFDRLATAEITPQWLAREWGLGGYGWTLADGTRAMVDFRPGGITLRTFDGREPVKWTWEQAAEALSSGQGELW